MFLIGILFAFRRFVGTPEADQVGGQHPIPGLGKNENHLAIEITPTGLAVQTQDDGTVPGTLIHKVDPQGAEIRIFDRLVVGLEGITGQVDESGIWGA
jgi:hypothetical protein